MTTALSIQTRRMIAEDSPEIASDSMFADLLVGIPFMPQMPTALKDFDCTITNEQIHEEGQRVFLVELRAIRDGHPIGTYMRGFEAPCANSDLTDEFDAEWPEPDSFPQGRDDFAYGVECQEADIAIAAAKMTCQTRCPKQAICLALALTTGESKQFLGGDSYAQPSGVRGGWGATARKSINAARILHWRNYRKGLTAEQSAALDKLIDAAI
jgi:hypothetical protein